MLLALCRIEHTVFGQWPWPSELPIRFPSKVIGLLESVELAFKARTKQIWKTNLTEVILIIFCECLKQFYI